MEELKFFTDYKNNETLRKSFFELADRTFGLKFESWYQKGFWDEQRYIPFSYVDGDVVIANVSVNILDFIMNDEKKKAIQIGTVMTHPDYRKRGLSASLMNKVLEEYENKYDFMYLFANKAVLDFYPKFGFNAVEENIFSMKITPNQCADKGVKRLNGKLTDELDFIYNFSSKRIPISQRFGTDHSQGIFMYYCLNVFSDDIYYLEEEDVIVIYIKENNQIDIFDIISRKEFNIQDILKKIAGNEIERVVFHFTPDYPNINTESNSYQGSEVLFVKINGENHFPPHFKHPITSQA
ncbi:GNAT family N-acetyltransferase [Paenibacillus planticolens]|uniref:GNAT family N-acetyltransferase n=1 Tax=Paenibacillus planticolens TaxID=2654976 RepID=A0ABX1ZF78_9BACL|nr:GNAT family N-acetyltransferase [Paenibacillus planticolens]NOU98525.1 GNAT family N-acetyltransferase [Paenibacillus planticolens]